MTAAAALTAFAGRKPDGRVCVEFGAPLEAPAGVSEESAVEAMLRGFNARLEAAVRGAPEQYWWAHRRWKTRPEGAAIAAESGATRARPP